MNKFWDDARRKSETSVEEYRQLSRGLLPVIWVGRCFGLLCHGNILQDAKPRRFRLSTIVTAILVGFLTINAGLLLRRVFLKFQVDKTTIVRADGFSHFGYGASMLFIYAYQLFYGHQFREIIQNVRSILFQPVLAIDYQFARFPLTSCILLGITLFLGISENAMYDIGKITETAEEEHLKTASNLNLYYVGLFPHWHCILPKYNAYATFFIVAFVKICTFGWFYADVISIVLCRMVYYMLCSFEKSLVENLTQITQQSTQDPRNKIFAKQMSDLVSSMNFDFYQADYLKIFELTIKIEKYIAPQILSNYAANIYVLVVMLFHWLGPFQKSVLTTEQNLYVCYAFFQYCYKVTAVTYFAAEISQKSLSIKSRLQMCPNYLYNVAIQRLDQMLTENPAGISLFGTFLISRRYFVSILVFIFTTEIILLQTYAGYASSLH